MVVYMYKYRRGQLVKMALGFNSILLLAVLGSLLLHKTLCVSPLASMFDSLDDKIHYTVKWLEDGSKESMV